MILEMKKLTLIGHKSIRHKLFNKLNSTQNVEVVSTKEFSNTFRLDNQTQSILIQQKMQKIDSVLEEINQTKNDAKVSIEKFVDVDKNKYKKTSQEQITSLEEFESIGVKEIELLSVADEVIELVKKKDELKKSNTQLEELISRISKYRDVDIEFNKIKDTERCAVILGSVNLSKMTRLKEIASEDNYCIEYIQQKNEIIFIAVSFREEKDKLLSKLNELEYIPCSENFDKKPNEILYESEKNIKNNRAEIEKITYDILAKRKYVRDLKILYDFYFTEVERNKALDEFATTKKSFILVGYYPKEKENEVEKMLTELPTELIYFLDEVTEEDDVPTLVKSKGIIEPYEYVTNLYSAPKYGKDLDPNPIMAIFYFIFFGMMVADAAYGLILTVTTLALYFIKKPRKGKGQMLLLIAMGGISTMIWGIIFGGYFGIDLGKFTHGKRYAAFNPIEGNGPLLTLGISMGLGFLHIIVGMFLKAIKLGREKRYFEIFSKVVVWYMIFLGIGVLALGMLGPSLKIKNSKYISYAGYAILGVSVLSIFLSGMYGKKGAKKILGIFGGFGELYGGIGFLSDILSYARLFGLGLAGGVIAMVVNQICNVVIDIFVGINPALIALGYIIATPVFIIGHGFNIGLSTLGAFVHNSRLQYIEFFGKFYEGGGHLFKPFGTQKKYTYLDLRR